MAILVTGGAGFIGSHLIEQLLTHDGDELILCLDNFNRFYSPEQKWRNIAGFEQHPRVRVLEQDFCDADAMQALFRTHVVRQVIHLGGYAGVRYSVENPLVYQQANVGGTLALLEAARAYPVQRFLLASSSTVYGATAQVPFQEDQPLGVPLSPYGATKRAAELLAFCYGDLHGVPVVCLRPFSVYGSRLRPDLVLSIFTARILAGEPLPLFGDGSMQRDFTHVRDICQGILAALTAPAAVGEAINLGHSQPIPMRDVIATLEDALGRKAVIDYQPAKEADMQVTCADLSKAQRLLNYRPQVGFADGVAEFVSWYRDQAQTQTQAD